MRSFDEIDPISIDNNSSVAGSLSDNRSPTTTYYVLTPNDYAIIVVCDLFTNKKTGESKWLTHQLEFPRSGINWIVNTIEKKFLKLSHEGGLPAAVRHYEEIVDGEELGISRAMGLGTDDNRESGYTIYTHSRKSEWDTSKKMSFTDSFLFEHGFFDLLKDLAAKIEKGII